MIPKVGEEVAFIGCSQHQIAWGNCDDPNPYLEISERYVIECVKVHSQHTKIKLVGIDGWFNSVCFIRSDDEQQQSNECIQ